MFESKEISDLLISKGGRPIWKENSSWKKQRTYIPKKEETFLPTDQNQEQPKNKKQWKQKELKGEKKEYKRNQEAITEKTQKVFVPKKATFIAPEAKTIKGWGTVKFNSNQNNQPQKSTNIVSNDSPPK